MRRDKQKQLMHLLAGITFILVAFYIFERNDLVISIVSFSLGSLFLIVAGIHTWLLKTFRDISLAFIWVEAACMFYAAYSFFKKSTPGLYNLFTAFAGLYIVLALYFHLTHKRRKHHQHHKRRDSSENLSF